MSIPVPLKQLGKDGPLVPTMGFGAMGLSVGYSTPGPDSERLKVLDRAYELGARHWDTSNVYGDNEELIGKWLKLNPEKRKDIFLATKFGGIVDKPGFSDEGGFRVRSDPEWAKESCEIGLKRLGVEYVDLFYVHRADRVTPIEKTIQAMAELKK